MITILKLLISLQTVIADLPIHATLDQITNEWEFTLVPISQSGFTSKEERLPENYIPACGSSLPNSNDDNLQAALQLKYIEWAEAAQISFTKRPFTESIRVNLTAERLPVGEGSESDLPLDERRKFHRSDWQGLGVYRGDKVIGRWTMIYDEAFEVVLDSGRLKLTALLKYSMKPGHPSCLQEEASEDRHGKNRCYITDPSETLLGWFEANRAEEDDGSKQIYGCLRGKQVGTDLRKITDFELMRKIVKLKGRKKPVRQDDRLADFSESRAEQPPLAQSLMRKSLSESAEDLSLERSDVFGHPSLTELSNELGVKYEKCSNPDERLFDVSEGIPESFSWGDPFLAPEKMTEHDKTLWQQGECGSCYALASVYALQKRSEILLARETLLEPVNETTHQLRSRLPKEMTSFLSSDLSGRALLAAALPVRLSPKSLLTCSFYNQGCQGGYPFLVGKWAQQFGITTDNCEGVYSPASLGQCSLPHSLYPASDEEYLRPRLPNRGSEPSSKSQSDEDRTNERTGSEEGTEASLDTELQRETSDADEKARVQRATVPMVLIGNGEEARYRSRNSGLRSPPLTLASKDCAYQTRVFAADYGYVGGCFECCNELAMRKEIFWNGPIVAALDSPPSFISYTNGVFTDHPHQHFARCSPTEANNHLAGWEYTNHAIALVGFGSLRSEPKDIHYWIGRNSWGNDWGLDGYFLIERGRNLGGIENQAVFLDPDTSRGILRQLLKTR